MSAERKKITTVDGMLTIRQRLRDEGKTVVQCHGCFDIVHPGHVRYLRFARDQGDVLVVSVSADSVVGKGIDRPYINEELRLENLAALEIVDFVCLDEHNWAGPILEKLKPDVYVKGKEYETSGDNRFLRERRLVEQYGGKVIFSSGDVVYSSSTIIDRFREVFQLDHEKVRFFRQRHQLSAQYLRDLVSAESSLRILVVGDPIIDEYVHCEPRGLASESPVLTVSPLQQMEYYGGAALIARQMAAFGAEVTFLTVLADQEADRFRYGLSGRGVTTEVVSVDARPLYRKRRYIVDDKKVFKVDKGLYAPLSSVAITQFARLLEQHIGGSDAVIATDFGYGLFPPAIIEAMTESCRKLSKPYFVDVSHSSRANILKFHGPALVAPTEAELRLAFGDNESGISHLASRYYGETNAGYLITTMGKRGVVLFDPPSDEHSRLTSDYLPAFNPQPIDTVGAGDIFLSTVVHVSLMGGKPAAGAYLGSTAAALHMRHLGNEPLSPDEIARYIVSSVEFEGPRY